MFILMKRQMRDEMTSFLFQKLFLDSSRKSFMKLSLQIE